MDYDMTDQKWVSVQDGLPQDGREVLVLVEGHFPNMYNPLSQNTTRKIFEGNFSRQTGWTVTFCPSNYRVHYWMAKPPEPS